MKGLPKKIGLFFLICCLFLGLTACGEQAYLDYKENTTNALKEISKVNDTFSAAVTNLFSDRTITDEEKKAVLDAITLLENAYQNLGEIKAPDKYQDVQSLLSEAKEKAVNALTIYKKEIGELTTETLNDSFLSRVSEGDTQLEAARELIRQAGEKQQEIEAQDAS